jgi:hypothetical protein
VIDLVQEADALRELTLAEVQTFLRRVAPPPAAALSAAAVAPPVTAPAVAPPEPAVVPAVAPPVVLSLVPGVAPVSLEAVAQRIASELSTEEQEAILKGSTRNSVPAQIDRRLLSAASQATAGAKLTPEVKRSLRAAFLDACRKAVTP